MTNVQEANGSRERDLRDYLAALRRQRTIFALAVVLVPAAALLLSISQRATYEATAQVLIGDIGTSADADRIAQTQVGVARVPLVASRTLQETHVSGRTVADFLAHSSVDAKSNADILDFSVKDRDPLLAQRLVNAYVHQFTVYRADLNSEPLAQSIRDVRSKISAVERHQASNTQLLAALHSKETQLETAQQVQSSNVRVLRTATTADKISPRPKLYLVLGVILGLVLGMALAVLADAFDSHVRSPAEVVDALGVSLLGLVPRSRPGRPDRPLTSSSGDPRSAGADAVRMLKSKLVLANRSVSARTIMFSSAAEDDGKPELIANLAVSLALGHRKVIVVDFDLRQSTLPGLLGLPAARGLTEVASGAVSLEEALSPVRLMAAGIPKAPQAGPPNTAFGAKKKAFQPSSRRQGELSFLSAGSPGSPVTDLTETGVVPALLSDLRSLSDLVLINAPSLLRASDGIALGTMVDAIVVVASARSTRRSDLSELRDVLASLRTTVMGVVLTDFKESRARSGIFGALAAVARGSADALTRRSSARRSSDVPASP